MRIKYAANHLEGNQDGKGAIEPRLASRPSRLNFRPFPPASNERRANKGSRPCQANAQQSRPGRAVPFPWLKYTCEPRQKHLIDDSKKLATYSIFGRRRRARARPSRCFCPPETWAPLGPTTVSSPSGRECFDLISLDFGLEQQPTYDKFPNVCLSAGLLHGRLVNVRVSHKVVSNLPAVEHDILINQGDLAAVLFQTILLNVHSIRQDATGTRIIEPFQHPQSCRLAAPARTHQGHKGSIFY